MILKMYSIKDSKALAFNVPFYQHTHGEAERSFTGVVNDGKSMMFNYPTDFDLYYLGEYDDQTGKIQPLDTPLHIIKAIQVKREETRQITQ